MRKRITKPPETAPFGLAMGLSVRDRDACGIALAMTSPFVFTASTVPRPRPDFNLYQVRITPDSGLSRVKGMSPFIKTDADGIALWTAFEAVEADLARVHGAGERIDEAAPERSLSDGETWMASLVSEARVCGTRWPADGGDTLCQGLEALYLVAKAINVKKGFLMLVDDF
ncbi:hypothetical protein, partial [uncultured Lamprocystis sp.]